MSNTLERPTSPRWLIGGRDHAKEKQISQELGLSPLVAGLLVSRGYSDPAAVHKFLNPSLDDLGDPGKLPDFQPALRAILAAKENRDLIFVHGDYDVDGVTSAAILHRFLNKIGCNVTTHVPHRIREGYGIHLQAVETAHEMGAKLFLTCDCGISAHEQVLKAKSLGMKVVVTDHHEIADKIPQAEAVINPHRTDSEYPESQLSGAGVVFRFCEGIAQELKLPIPQYRRAYLDLACLGTIADVMPLLGENRIIAKFGLEQLQNTQKVGLQALMKEANVGQDPLKKILAFNVGWQLGPRLNAVGRIADAAAALKLLIEYDPTEAAVLASHLEKVNQERRLQTAEFVEQAAELVIDNGYERSNMIVVADPRWHPGIVGIVAGRLVERFSRPCLVMTIDTVKGICKGSARSIPNFHLAEAIWAFPDLISGGGHAAAAGCSFNLSDLEEVRTLLNEYASDILTPEDLIPKIQADMEIRPEELTVEALDELTMLEPFGCANPEPLLFAPQMQIQELAPTKNPAHVRIKLGDSENRSSAGIAFNLGESLAETKVGDHLDVLFRPEINEFRGIRSPQWQIKHHRKSED